MASRSSEASLFWITATAYRRGVDRAEALDDLLVIAHNTDWPLLKHRCAEILAEPGWATG